MTTDQINILIVEDESIVALDLAAGLERDGYNVVGIADNAEEAISIFRENDVDIALMDINIIGDKDGVDTAYELLKIKQVPVIYLTAFTDAKTINRVKNTHPAAFLTKPYNISNVRIAIELAISNFATISDHKSTTPVIPLEKNAVKTEPEKEVILQMKEFIFIKQNHKFLKVALKDIWYAEAENNYIHLVCADRKYTLRLSLQQLEEKISYNRFVRIHRSYMVNIDAIRSFTETEVQVEHTELPIGRSYREAFIKQFNFSWLIKCFSGRCFVL